MGSEKLELDFLREEVERLNKVISVKNKDVDDSQDDLFEALAKLDKLTKVSWRLITEIEKIPSLGGLIVKNDLLYKYKLVAELKDLVVKFKEEQQETCQGVIPSTFIACGEGENYCQSSCHEQANKRKKE